MFSVVHTLLFKPFPYRRRRTGSSPCKPRRQWSAGGRPRPRRRITTATGRKRIAHSNSSSRPSIACSYNLTGGLEPERFPTLIVSPAAFSRARRAAGDRARVHSSRTKNGARIASPSLHLASGSAVSAATRISLPGQSITLNGEPFDGHRHLAVQLLVPRLRRTILRPYGFRAGRQHELSQQSLSCACSGACSSDVSPQQGAQDDLTAILASIVAEQSVNQQRYGVEPRTAQEPPPW